MGYVYTDEQLKDTLKGLKKIKKVRKSHDFDQLDYQMIVEALERSPMNKYISDTNHDKLESSPSVIDENKSYILDDYEELKVDPPIFLLPILEYSSLHSPQIGVVYSKKQLLEMAEAFLRTVLEYLNKGKNLYSEIENILIQADKHYQELRDMVSNLEDKFDNHFFDSLLILPDIFVYLCRLLASKHVDSSYKIKLILAIIYIVSPVDIVPEALMSYFGLFDDVIVATRTVLDGFSTNVISRESMKEMWPGNPDDVDNLEEYYQSAKGMLGEELDSIIRHVLRKRNKDVTA